MEEAPTTNLWNSWIISGSNGLNVCYKCWIIWVENLWKSPIWWLKNRKIIWEHYKELRPSERKSCRSFQPWKFDHMIRGCWRTSLGTGHIYADHLGIPDFLQGHAWSHSHISLVLFFLVTWQRFRKTAEKMWDTQNWCLPVDDWNPASKTGGATVDAWKFLQHLGVVNCRCRLPNWSDINGSNYECKQACHA